MSGTSNDHVSGSKGGQNFGISNEEYLLGTSACLENQITLFCQMTYISKGLKVTGSLSRSQEQKNEKQLLECGLVDCNAYDGY